MSSWTKPEGRVGWKSLRAQPFRNWSTVS